MKKNFKFMTAFAAGALIIGAFASVALSSCGGGTPGPIDPTDKYSGALKVSGPQKQDAWLKEKVSAYNKLRKDAGVPEITFEVVQYEEDKIDSAITDWSVGPDVYAYASDKILPLFQAGALATLPAANATWIKDTMGDAALSAVTFAGKVLSYPYAGDNGYFLYYNKSLVTEADCATIEGLLEKAGEKSMKVAYPLETAFYSAGALFTFGAKYEIHVDTKGVVTSVDADFDSANGILAGKAIYQIMKDPNWQNTQAAPTAENKLVACVDGSWNAATYENDMGADYACTKLPTVTVEGNTKNLGSYLGYKQYGVNPIVSTGKTDRLYAAHCFAKYLAGEDIQKSRFEEFMTAPTNNVVKGLSDVINTPSIKAIGAQSKFATPQTAVPGNIWTAPTDLTTGIKDGTVTLENIAQAMVTLNNAIKASK